MGGGGGGREGGERGREMEIWKRGRGSEEVIEKGEGTGEDGRTEGWREGEEERDGG